MARRKRKTASLLEDVIPVKAKEDLTSVFYNIDTNKNNFASANTDIVCSLKDKVKELEKKVAELALNDSKSRCRIKSIKVKF